MADISTDLATGSGAASEDDRAELIARSRQQARLDDPTVGFATAADFETGSLVWPDGRWKSVTIDHRYTSERRDVWECTYRRDEGEPLAVPVGFVWDKTNEDSRARVYYNKAHFGMTEPRRPLVAPENVPLPAPLEAYGQAIRAGDRARLEAIIREDAVFLSPVGPIDRERFISTFSSEPKFGVKGVPLQFCTVTVDDESYATEFISWRRPPHGGLSVYVFDEGRLVSVRIYEGPVYF